LDEVSLKSLDTSAVEVTLQNAGTECDAEAGMIGNPCVTGHFARERAADWMDAISVPKKRRLSLFKPTGSLCLWVVSEK
jgi:hypothetical protein